MTCATLPSKPVILDSGASKSAFEFTKDSANSNYLLVSSDVRYNEVEKTPHGPRFQYPDGNISQAEYSAYLEIPGLPKEARKIHLLNKLASGHLLSLGQLCDHGCKAWFDKHRVYIIHDSKIILQGQRNSATNNLWHMNLPPSPSNQINAAIDQPTIAERIKFIHAALFSPTLQTWTNALREGLLTTFPRITIQQIRKFPPRSEATVKGHMKAIKKGLSYVIEPSPSINATEEARVPIISQEEEILPVVPETSVPENVSDNTAIDSRTNFIYAKCETIKGQIFTDQTGRMAVTSSSGMNYVFTLYDYDSNLIWSFPIPTRTKHQIVKAYKQAYKMLQTKGLKPKLQRLDNECSELLKEYLDANNVKYQLTPSGKHSRNAAEKAIQIWKDHFISGLSSTHPDFPVTQWCKLVEHANITLNLLRSSRVNPALSAYAQIFGAFDYQATPLAPPGMKVLAHILPKDRKSFAAHAVKGYHVGPAMDHYRCFSIFIPSTKGTRIADTLRWFPHNHIKMPIASDDALLRTALDTLRAAVTRRLKNQILPHPEADNLKTLTDMNELFKNRDKRDTKITEIPKVPSCPIQVTDVPQQNITKESFDNAIDMFPNIQHKTTPVPRVEPTPPTITPVAEPTGVPRVNTPSKVNQLRTRLQRQIHSDNLRRKQQERNTHSARTLRSSMRARQTSQQSEFAYACSTLNLTQDEQDLIRKSNDAEEVRLSKCEEEFIDKQFQPEIAGAVLDEESGELMELKALFKTSNGDRWKEGGYRELSRLTTGSTSRKIRGTNTMTFVKPHELPTDKKATYARIVADYRPQKEDPYRVRITVGGDKVHYSGETYTPTADITTAKVLFNSVLSTPLAKFMNIDIKDFYLETKMDESEYMWIPRWIFTKEFIDEHGLEALFQNDRILVRIDRGMYGLPQAGRLAYVQLIKHLKLHGYERAGFTPGLFKHKTRKTIFSLVVDDFGVRYTSMDDAMHLINALKESYQITTDFDGKIFLGLHLDWNYKKRIVRISMPGYVRQALARFRHKAPRSPQHSPHPCAKIDYGAKIQFAKEPNKTDMTPLQLKWCQQVIGVFLFYARAIDATMLAAIGSIASHLSTSTWANISQNIHHFLDYAATHPDAILTFRASKMHLWIHTDASYLTEPKARSRAGGYHFFSDKPQLPITSDSPAPMHNHPVFVMSKIITAVMSSTQESETGGGYLNAKEGLLIRLAAIEMGHPQGPTPMQFDNKCAHGILTGELKQKQSRSMDMRFYWLRDRAQLGQQQFHVHWKRGDTNLGDYSSKAGHPTKYHQKRRELYVTNNSTIITKISAIAALRAACKGVLKSIPPT